MLQVVVLNIKGILDFVQPLQQTLELHKERQRKVLLLFVRGHGNALSNQIHKLQVIEIVFAFEQTQLPFFFFFPFSF
jgi:hypothetical protein